MSLRQHVQYLIESNHMESHLLEFIEFLSIHADKSTDQLHEIAARFRTDERDLLGSAAAPIPFALMEALFGRQDDAE